MPVSLRSASFCGRGAVAALALLAGTAVAVAQQPPAPQPAAPRPRPAAPAPAPAAPAAPAPAPAAPAAAAPAGPSVVQVKPEPSQAEWTKVCGKDQGNNAEICYTTRDFVSDQGQAVLAVAVYDVKGPQAQKIVRFLMPLGLLLQPGIRFNVDQGQPVPGKYAICFPNGCFAESPVKEDFIAAAKKGSLFNISVQNAQGREVTFAVPTAGFGKAFDGPAIDPAVLAEQQKKLQQELEKRSEEMRKRLESTAGAPGAPPAPAPKP